MIRVRYVEIENFKTFSRKLHIDLGHPAVLIGPNNAGKTSVIQALSLWSRGVKSWVEKKGVTRNKETRERYSAGINRLHILEVPVAENRFFWNATRVRRGNKSVEMVINVGLESAGVTRDCRLIFTYRDTEVIYCKPCPETLADEELLNLAAGLHCHLLYPMSGIMAGVSSETEEPLLQDGRINVYLGQGQTAQVLRNICYKVVENDPTGTDWARIAALMKRLFLVDVSSPALVKVSGSLRQTYRQAGVDNALDISLAGRGLQQMLLILAYLHWHKRSLLLVDEPDAHLEILRQKQVYELLRHVAEETDSQVVIATHSEVILQDAIDVNLTLLLNGESIDLARKNDVKNALRHYGIEHYIKARVHPRILYVEGSTDVEMLRALARHLGHRRAEEILEGTPNVHYTRNIEPEPRLENQLDLAAGVYDGDIKQHFFSIKKVVPGLQGIALLDGDAQARREEVQEDLTILYWSEYELENYFLTPQVIVRYVECLFPPEDLFHAPASTSIREAVDEGLLEMVCRGDRALLEQFHASGPAMQRMSLGRLKASALAERIFATFARRQGQSTPLLRKGEYYRLVAHCRPEDIPEEVRRNLDQMAAVLSLD